VERLAWALIGRTARGERRWTDDTQMALDLAASLTARGAFDPDDAARRFAAGYRWSRGYGPAAAKTLKRIRRGVPWREANRAVYADGSLGNGGAMRVAPAALFCFVRGIAPLPMARAQAEITHAHPLGVEGAALVAAAVHAALGGADGDGILAAAATGCDAPPHLERLERAAAWRAAAREASPAEVADALGNGVLAVASCATAAYLGARFLDAPFEDLARFTAALSGDVDTIGAMAGAIRGAARGEAALPAAALDRLEGRVQIAATADALLAAAR